MYFRWTLFNGCTLLLMALTIPVAVARLRGVLESNWPLLYYAALLAYWKAFEGGLSTYAVLLGVACGVLLRFEFLGGVPLTFVRVLEYFFFAYVLWRGLTLVLMLPW